MITETINWISIHRELFIYMGLILLTIFATIIFARIRIAIREKNEWRKKYKDFDYNYTEVDKLNKKTFGDML